MCRGSAPVPTPTHRGNHGGIAPTELHNSLRRAIEVLRKSCLNFELVTAKESLNEEIRGKIAVETVRNVMA